MADDTPLTTVTHYHIESHRFARPGIAASDDRGAGIADAEEAREAVIETCMRFTGRGFEKSPAWGFLITTRGYEGVLLSKHRRGFLGRKDMIEDMWTLEIVPCDYPTCPLGDGDQEQPGS